MGSLVWGMLFGAIGMGYLLYARQQRALLPLVCGFGLIAFPYFVDAIWLIVLIGAVLMAIPWRFR